MTISCVVPVFLFLRKQLRNSALQAKLSGTGQRERCDEVDTAALVESKPLFLSSVPHCFPNTFLRAGMGREQREGESCCSLEGWSFRLHVSQRLFYISLVVWRYLFLAWNQSESLQFATGTHSLPTPDSHSWLTIGYFFTSRPEKLYKGLWAPFQFLSIVSTKDGPEAFFQVI